MLAKCLACDFCAKPEHEVKVLIRGPVVYICDECARLCVEIVESEQPVSMDQADLPPGCTRLHGYRRIQTAEILDALAKARRNQKMEHAELLRAAVTAAQIRATANDSNRTPKEAAVAVVEAYLAAAEKLKEGGSAPHPVAA